jgi:hypothetical protein
MTSLYKFENITDDEQEEGVVVGGAIVQINKKEPDMPIKRFENLVVPIGLVKYSINETNGGGSSLAEEVIDDAVINESRFSKLFYSVAQDLGSSRKKTKR